MKKPPIRFFTQVQRIKCCLCRWDIVEMDKIAWIHTDENAICCVNCRETGTMRALCDFPDCSEYVEKIVLCPSKYWVGMCGTHECEDFQYFFEGT